MNNGQKQKRQFELIIVNIEYQDVFSVLVNETLNTAYTLMMFGLNCVSLWLEAQNIPD